MIAVACSRCGKSLRVKDELAGKKGKCPECGAVIRIPVGSTAGHTMNPRDVDPPAWTSHTDAMDALTIQPEKHSISRPAKVTPREEENTDSGAGELNPEVYDFLAPAQAEDEIGRLGPYRILKVLGAGGMGVVFQGEDPQLQRKVALKAMLPTLAVSESAKKRFLREARAAAAIEHTHIVAIFQVGEDRGVPYLAMPFLKGEPLDVRLHRESPLPEAEVLRIGREIALGLAAAHEQGLIHRDIKPANIWLEGKEGLVKILDFGLARAVTEKSNLTQPGSLMGTPGYMAPEQASGHEVDARCDLFSLGCVLYRMAAGEVPFKGNDTISTLLAVACKEATPPHEVNPQVSEGLSALIMHLLEKEPDDRPASMRAVVKKLDAAASGTAESTLSIQANRLPGRKLPARSSRPPLWVWLAGGGAAAGVLLGIGLLAAGFFSPARAQRSTEELASKGEERKPPSDTGGKTGEEPVDPEEDRRVADLVLKLGGKVRLELGNSSLSEEISDPDGMPTKAVRLRAVILRDQPNLTSAHLQTIGKAKNLQAVDLSGSKVTDKGAEYLGGLTALQNLRLTSTSVTDLGLEFLKDLKDLRALSLYGTTISPKGLGFLDGLKKLKRLWLCNLQVPEEDVKGLEKRLPGCRIVTDHRLALQTIKLGGRVGIVASGERDPRTAQEAGTLPKLPYRVRTIIFHGQGQLKDADLEYLDAAPGIESIGLANNPTLTSAAFKYLGDLTELENISTSNIAVGDLGMKHLRGLTKVISLTLYLAGVSDEGLRYLKGWKLRGLDLQSNQIRGPGLAHLKGMNTLTSVTLNNNPIGNDGFKLLSVFPNLTRLSLGSNEAITDEGLTPLRKLTKLRWLHILSHELTDKTFDLLMELKDLEHLSLGHTKITAAGVARFNKALPRCQVHLFPPLK
jgi:serine/threonine protein kinase